MLKGYGLILGIWDFEKMGPTMQKKRISKLQSGGQKRKQNGYQICNFKVTHAKKWI